MKSLKGWKIELINISISLLLKKKATLLFHSKLISLKRIDDEKKKPTSSIFFVVNELHKNIISVCYLRAFKNNPKKIEREKEEFYCNYQS